MRKKTKLIEVITGEKVEGDVDPTRAIEGKGSARGETTEAGGRSADGALLFECPWCGAINHAEQRGDATFYVCFACGRPMQPHFA